MSITQELFARPAVWQLMFAFLAMSAASVVAVATIWAIWSPRHWFVRATSD